MVCGLSRQVCVVLLDNSTVLAYRSMQGDTKSAETVPVEIRHFTQLHTIDLQARHILERRNVLADELSRQRVLATVWTLATATFQWLLEGFPK